MFYALLSADIVFSTAHKSKGLEFDTVKLTNDYLENYDHRNDPYGMHLFCQSLI